MISFDGTSVFRANVRNIKLLDAITISLPDQIVDDYVGMGGRNAKAALKIQTLYSAIHHSITEFEITSWVTHDVNTLPTMVNKLTENELLKLYKAISETYSIYETLDLKELLQQNNNSIDQEVYIGSENCNKLKVRLVGIKLSDEIAAKRIKKAILQNNGSDIDDCKRHLLHWNCELLGAFLTMPLYDCIDQSMLNTQGRGVSIQRFYTLLVVDLYQFYTKEKITLHTYEVFAALLQRIAKLALIEKRLRQTTYSRMESYLEQLLVTGKT